MPLITKNRVIGVIDIEAREPGYFTEEHKRVLTLVASRMAAGIENAQLYTRTTKQARILLLLNEIARELTSILNLDELLGRIAELVRRLIDYQMFSILLLDASGEKLQHRFSLRFNENIHLKHEIALGRGLVGYAAESKQAVLVPDVSKDPRYVEANPETRSELAVPLIYKGKVIGVLDLEHTRRGFFTEEHQRTMTTLAAQIAIAVENARLVRGDRTAGAAIGARPFPGAGIAGPPAAAVASEAGSSRCRGEVRSGPRHRGRSLRFHSLLDVAAWHCRSATSAARARRPPSTLRWSAEFSARMPPSSPARPRCFRR